ncbi:MAG: hypothetical protein GY925_07175 [Actinomycetia bacterium]|nr:hypothetical protein [Actinomycetes bacterium]
MISRVAFHYVDRVHRALSDGGRLVCSVVHLVITSRDTSGGGPRTSWTVDGHFDRGLRERFDQLIDEVDRYRTGILWG